MDNMRKPSKSVRRYRWMQLLAVVSSLAVVVSIILIFGFEYLPVSMASTPMTEESEPSASPTTENVNDEAAPPVVWEPVFTSDTAVWSFLEGSAAIEALSDPEQSWRVAGYDDSSWGRGVGSFGAKYGEQGELSAGYYPANLLQQYDGNADSYPVYLLRMEFFLDGIDQIGELLATLRYDDAVVVYVNEVVVFQGNVPEGGYATADAYGAAEPAGSPIDASFPISFHLLNSGVNTLAVELHQAEPTSSDVYFDFASLIPQSPVLSPVVVGIGADERSAHFTVQATGVESVNTDIRLVPSAEPGAEAIIATVYEVAPAESGFLYRASVTNLKPNTRYHYTVSCRGLTAEGMLATGDPTDGVDVLFVGDPQLGSSGSTMLEQQDSLGTATLAYADGMDFAAVMGDVVNDASDAYAYELVYETMGQTHLAQATVFGNHDVGTNLLSDRLAVPNVSDAGALSDSGVMSGDYWFSYGDVLFLVLNSNSAEFARHSEFMHAAVAASTATDGAPQFRVVLMHHALYSQSTRNTESYAQSLREGLGPTFEALDIDLVVSGHEHLYSRSHLMRGESVLYHDVAESTIQKQPGETLYLTTGSSSGSKYYDLNPEWQPQMAAYAQPYAPIITQATFLDDTLTVSTFNCVTGELVDEFTLLT